MEQAVTVDPLQERVEGMLLQRFPGSTFEAEWSPAHIRLGGILIWEQFDGMSQMERQDLVWKALDEAVENRDFDPFQRQRLTAIFTVTPEELEMMREEVAV